MNIRFVKDTELEIVVDFDDNMDTATTETEIFVIGDETEVDILDTDEELKTVDMQFGDGSIAFGVPSDVFIEVGEYSKGGGTPTWGTNDFGQLVIIRDR